MPESGCGPSLAAPLLHAHARQPPFSMPEIKLVIHHMCKLQLFVSGGLIFQGIFGLFFAESIAYTSACNAAVFSGFFGIITGCVGLWTFTAAQRKLSIVLHLFLCIIAAVATLIHVVLTAMWLISLLKLDNKDSTANAVMTTQDRSHVWVMSLHWFVLLISVGEGLCCIMSAAFICYLWDHQKAVHSLTTLTQMLDAVMAQRVTHQQALPTMTDLMV